MCHKSWEPPIYETSVETGAHEGEHEGVNYGCVCVGGGKLVLYHRGQKNRAFWKDGAE